MKNREINNGLLLMRILMDEESRNRNNGLLLMRILFYLTTNLI